MYQYRDGIRNQYLVIVSFTGNLLLSEGYLQETPVYSGFGSTVDLTDVGRRWLSSGQKELMLTSNHELLALENVQIKPELTLTSRFNTTEHTLFVVIAAVHLHLFSRYCSGQVVSS